MAIDSSNGSLAQRLMAPIRIGCVGMWTIFWTVVALIVHLFTGSHVTPLKLARRVWAPGALRFMGARMDVRGLDRVDFSESYLFVANHTSQLDIPLLFAALPVPLRFLAKEELRRVPLVGRFIAAMGMVFVDRGDSQAARGSIDQLASLLASGMALMAFPEGTRSRDGELGRFKTGAFVGAIKSGRAVVPIFIEGADTILPAGSLRARPGRVVVTIGTPVPSRHLDVANRRELADLVREKMMEMGALVRRQL